MLRVAVVSAAPDEMLVDKPGWVADGLAQAGCDVRRAHDLAGVRRADAQCDLLLFDQHGAGCNVASLVELAARRRAIWAQWWRDLVHYDRSKPLAEQDHLRSFGRFFRAIDHVFVKEREQLHDYRRLGIEAGYLDQACPAHMSVCGHAERPEFDVLVAGTTAYAQRRADARALAAAGHRVVWAGLAGREPLPPGVSAHPWVHPTRELPALAARSAVVLGVDYTSEVAGYTSDRSYLAGGMGACYIARVGVSACGGGWSLGELAAIAPALHAASWCYETTGELLDCVRRALADAGERRARGLAARARIMRDHTYQARAETILQVVFGSGAAPVAGQATPGR
jgi:hypothetical protein